MSSYQVSEDYLLNHAYRNVWCTPEQDKQAILQLPRVTPQNGVWTHFSYQWRKIQLPVTGSGARFHVYQIGQVHPSLLGLLATPNVWISAKTVMEKECVLVDVYNSKGIMIPRGLCWYIVTGDKNLLVAIRKPNEAPTKRVDLDLETDAVFMRVYSNAYFNTLDASFADNCIKVGSVRVNDIAMINAFQTEVSALPNYGGKFYYVNGRRVDKIDLVTAKAGDYLEYVFDASIKREVVFKVRDLQEFESTLDGLHKYLLHYAGTSSLIDYQDDIDLYVGASYGQSRWHGVYLHKNDSRTMRMVTHRDYSIPVIRPAGAQAANEFLKDADLEVRMTIRHSGYDRPLIQENSRIFELYKLPSVRIPEAMTGLDSTVSVWEAGALEACAYTEIMRQPQGGVTREMVQKAYGYNSMSKLLGDTPARIKLFSGQKVVVVPEGLRGCCTIYEYNAAGKLLFFAQHTVDNTYTCQSADAAFVEIIYGLGGVDLDVVDNSITGDLNYVHNYRFYVGEANGNGGGNWKDKTGEPYYLIQNGKWRWIGSAAPVNRVLSNRKHLAYTFTMAPLAGVFEFDITIYKDGIYKKLDMPLGELDLFFNGNSLIEGLDYIAIGARVTIITKKYMNESLPKQAITVRYTGFCNKDMGRTPAPDVGFVFHGNLSVNNRFDIRDDKVLRIVCGGSVRLRDELDFAEDGIGVSLTNTLNGTPYAIRDIIVPMNNYLVGGAEGADKTYEYRAASMAIDDEVSDYLTRMLPETKVTAPNVIQNRHPIYSPFLSRIIADLLSGVLVDEKFYEHFGDDWLRTRLASYERLLPFDLAAQEPGPDARYVVVHPHPYKDYVSLTMYQWRVVQRAAKLYVKNVELSSTINVLQF